MSSVSITDDSPVIKVVIPSPPVLSVTIGATPSIGVTALQRGPKGDPGPAGADSTVPGPPAAKFIYTQIAPSTLWHVPHNLNTFPDVVIIDSSGERIYTTILYDLSDLNNLTLSFAAAESGIAVCS